ncbi:MAG: winged helix-turn-helix domain-containing protein [Chloroflexota bacterium]
MKDILSNLALEWTPSYPTNRQDVVLDIFWHHISYKDGLPPYAQARIIDLIVNQLIKARPHPALWISVETPGNWFYAELKRLVKFKIPMTIQPAWKPVVWEWQFSSPIQPTHIQEGDAPSLAPCFDPKAYGIKGPALRILQILARLKTAYRPEIASLAGFSESHVRNLLKQLQVAGLIERRQIGKYEGWAIRANGLRLAHRSWNIPKGVHFTKYRGEFRYAGERHRRKARMWRAWLEQAYPDIDIWEAWTEVPILRGIPDALAWGTHQGKEMLFWLEVDSGKSSGKTMQRIYSVRIAQACRHAVAWDLPILFCIMGPGWVVRHFRKYDYSKFTPIALIGHDWRDFGGLPQYAMGEWCDDLLSDRALDVSTKKLPFDPSQYPPKPKKEKSIKPPKPKSSKPRFSIGETDDDAWSGDRSEAEE